MTCNECQVPATPKQLWLASTCTFQLPWEQQPGERAAGKTFQVWLKLEMEIAKLLMVKRLSDLFRKTSAEDIRLIIRRYEKDFDICGYHETLNDLRTLLKIKTQATKYR